MKKALFLFIIIAGIQRLAMAQTEAPVITRLHALLQSAKSNFVNDLDKKIDEDTTAHTIYYEAKTPVTGADCFFAHYQSGVNMMVISYDAKGEKAVAMMPIVDQYIDELNKMVKTGNFTGEDYKNKAGLDVTDVKDKEGNLVLRYTSSHEFQRIYLYGYINNNK